MRERSCPEFTGGMLRILCLSEVLETGAKDDPAELAW